MNLRNLQVQSSVSIVGFRGEIHERATVLPDVMNSKMSPKSFNKVGSTMRCLHCGTEWEGSERSAEYGPWDRLESTSITDL